MSSTPRPSGRRPYAARLPLEERRSQILDAALAIIVREGYEAVTISAVAAEAGVTRPVIYGAFDDLATLQVALLDRTQQRAVDQLMAVLQPLLDARAPLADWAHQALPRLAAMVADDEHTWRPILLIPAGQPAFVAERIELTRQGLRSILADIVAERLPPASGVSPSVVAHTVLATTEHVGRLLLDHPEQVDIDAFAETLIAVVAAFDRPER